MSVTLHCFNSNSNYSSSPSLQLNYPTSFSPGPDPKEIEVGDLLLFVGGSDDGGVYTGGIPPFQSAPDGFTYLGGIGDEDTDCITGVYYKIADEFDVEYSAVRTRTLTWRRRNRNKWGALLLISGIDPNDFIDQFETSTSSGSTAVNAPEITNTATNCLNIAIATEDDHNTSRDCTISGSGYEHLIRESYQWNTSYPFIGIVGYKYQASSGASGTPQFSTSNTDWWSIVHLSIKGPASSSASATPSGSPSSTPSEGTPSSTSSIDDPTFDSLGFYPQTNTANSFLIRMLAIDDEALGNFTVDATPSEGTPSGSPTAGTPSEGTPSSSPSEGTPSSTPSEGTPSGSPSEGTLSTSPSEGTPSSSPGGVYPAEFKPFDSAPTNWLSSETDLTHTSGRYTRFAKPENHPSKRFTDYASLISTHNLYELDDAWVALSLSIPIPEEGTDFLHSSTILRLENIYETAIVNVALVNDNNEVYLDILTDTGRSGEFSLEESGGMFKAYIWVHRKLSSTTNKAITQVWCGSDETFSNAELIAGVATEETVYWREYFPLTSVIVGHDGLTYPYFDFYVHSLVISDEPIGDLEGLSTTPSEGTPSDSPSEGTPSDSPSEGTPSDSPSEGTPSEGTPSDSPSEGTPSEGTPSEGTPSRSPSEGTPSEGTPSRSPSDSPSEGTPSEGTPSDSPSDSPSEGTPSEGTPSDSPSDSPSEGTPSEGTPSRSPSDSPSEGTPSEGTPSEGTPSDSPSDSPSEGTPSEGTPSEGTPSDSPSEGTPSASPHFDYPFEYVRFDELPEYWADEGTPTYNSGVGTTFECGDLVSSETELPPTGEMWVAGNVDLYAISPSTSLTFLRFFNVEGNEVASIRLTSAGNIEAYHGTSSDSAVNPFVDNWEAFWVQCIVEQSGGDGVIRLWHNDHGDWDTATLILEVTNGNGG